MTVEPVREPAFLILTALAERPQHGYGLIEDLRRLSDGRVRLRAGSLYAALDRLRTGGLIEIDHEEVVSSRLRRYYRLTGNGETTLTAEAQRRREQAETAETLLRRGRAARTEARPVRPEARPA
jgi:DNA-binding PadR family transcriptional regulator